MVPVHVPYGAVNDGLIDGLQALLAANDKLAEGQDKVGLFSARGLSSSAVIEVHIHRVHILGRAVHAFPGRGEAVPPARSSRLHKGKILGFGVADDNVVVGNEEGVCDFPLCRKGFPAARRSQG